MYEMKEEYFTGIEEIDNEHRRLFEIAEEAYQLHKNEFIPDKYDQIKKILKELRDYAQMHFEHEEAYMESIQYKKMFTQKVQHASFIKWLDEHELAGDGLDGEYEDQDQVVSDILTYLTNWLITHILETDKQIPAKEQ